MPMMIVSTVPMHFDEICWCNGRSGSRLCARPRLAARLEDSILPFALITIPHSQLSPLHISLASAMGDFICAEV